MMLIVEMVIGETGQPGFTTFDLQVKTWRKLLEVAEKFGWTPEGTFVDEDSAKRNPDYIGQFQPTYKVEPWGYCKRVTDTDAIGLSRALTAAFIAIKAGDIAPLTAQNQVLIRDGMTKEEFESVNLSSNDSLRDFAEFTSKGGFVFAWDD
jgi:hypothetical protein